MLPRFYGFSALGQPLQLFALASVFILATSFMGQAAGAWFKHPETPTLIFLGTSLPQLFLTGFSWPREAIPKPVLAAGYIFPSDFAIDGIVRIDQLGASLWEVARDWRGLWVLAIVYFALAVISAFLVKRRQATWLAAGMQASSRSALLLVAAGAGGYVLWRPEPAAPIVGVVRATEIRVAPEVGGQLAAIKVQKGDRVRAGDVVAELSALELTAAVAQARAALAAAVADRDHVYAGVRAEEIAALAAGIAKAKSKLEYVEAQLARVSYLARSDTASQQSLDQAENDAAIGARRRRRGGSQSRCRASRADPGAARHRRRAGQGRGVRARGARAAAG